jgi:thioredoxin 1
VVKEINTAEFAAATGSGIVLVDFWADWCSPCKALSPIIHALSDEYSGRVSFLGINADSEPTIIANNRIAALPTVLIFQNGEVKEKLVGLRRKADFQAALERLLKEAPDGQRTTTETDQSA